MSTSMLFNVAPNPGHNLPPLPGEIVTNFHASLTGAGIQVEAYEPKLDPTLLAFFVCVASLPAEAIRIGHTFLETAMETSTSHQDDSSDVEDQPKSKLFHLIPRRQPRQEKPFDLRKVQIYTTVFH